MPEKEGGRGTRKQGAQEVKGQVAGFEGRDDGRREERKEGRPAQGEEGQRRDQEKEGEG